MEETDFTKPWSKSDVTFEVEQKKLYFNRGVLAFYSDVFDRMFNAEFAESDPKKVIPLPGKKFDDVQALFFVLKSRPADFPNPITNENLHVLLAMSDEYQMQQLVVECEKLILWNWKSDPTKHIEAVVLAFQYRMKAVAEAFLPLAACRLLSEIDAAADSLPAEVYAAILHGNMFRSQHAPSIWVSQGVVIGYVPKNCQICNLTKFETTSYPGHLCQCTTDAPTNDPKIQAVLKNFAKISMKMK